MRRWRILVAFSCFSMAAAQPLSGPEQAFELPSNVRVERDLPYTQVDGRMLKLDLYQPAEGDGPFPAVVYIHGGGWRGGSKKAFRRQAAHMAALGFVGACIEYRLSGEAKFPAALHDSKAAVRWLRAHAAQYRIDSDRIGAAGGSAGGHLAAMLGLTHHIPEFEGPGGWTGFSSRISAVAAFNPALDLAEFGRTRSTSTNAFSAVSAFLGVPFDEDPQLWISASPIHHVQPEAAAFLLLHGTQDPVVPYQQSVRMLQKLERVGVAVDLFTAEGATHGFFNSPPWFDPTLERMAKFFLRYLSR